VVNPARTTPTENWVHGREPGRTNGRLGLNVLKEDGERLEELDRNCRARLLVEDLEKERVNVLLKEEAVATVAIIPGSTRRRPAFVSLLADRRR